MPCGHVGQQAMLDMAFELRTSHISLCFRACLGSIWRCIPSGNLRPGINMLTSVHCLPLIQLSGTQKDLLISCHIAGPSCLRNLQNEIANASEMKMLFCAVHKHEKKLPPILERSLSLKHERARYPCARSSLCASLILAACDTASPSR